MYVYFIYFIQAKTGFHAEAIYIPIKLQNGTGWNVYLFIYKLFKTNVNVANQSNFSLL